MKSEPTCAPNSQELLPVEHSSVKRPHNCSLATAEALCVITGTKLCDCWKAYKEQIKKVKKLYEIELVGDHVPFQTARRMKAAIMAVRRHMSKVPGYYKDFQLPENVRLVEYTAASTVMSSFDMMAVRSYILNAMFVGLKDRGISTEGFADNRGGGVSTITISKKIKIYVVVPQSSYATFPIVHVYTGQPYVPSHTDPVLPCLYFELEISNGGSISKTKVMSTKFRFQKILNYERAGLRDQLQKALHAVRDFTYVLPYVIRSLSNVTKIYDEIARLQMQHNKLTTEVKYNLFSTEFSPEFLEAVEKEKLKLTKKITNLIKISKFVYEDPWTDEYTRRLIKNN